MNYIKLGVNMNKKIISITTVKNEADIIESFIRYNLNIVDEMIILNNGSTDETEYILNQLKNEGLLVHIINDEDRYFEPSEKYNFLLKKAITEFNADIICPLDADEFIVCEDDENPRKTIEKITPHSYYKIKWKTYIPTEADEDILFIPSRIKHIRSENIESFYKIILTKELFLDYNVKIEIGNHDLIIDSKFKNKITSLENTNLRIAHFPLRSKEQTTSKVLVNYPNTLSRKKFNPNYSHHYPKMFKKMKEIGEIDIKDVTEFAKEYSLESNEMIEKIDIILDPINLEFCKNIEIKYNFKINPLENLLENYIYFAKEIHNFKNQIENLENKNDKLKIKNNEYKNSNSWKITAPLRKMKNFFK